MIGDLPGLFVDPACPLDWDHPLNHGLVADFTVIPNPGWRGGMTVRDLVRGVHRAHDAAMTNPASPVGSQWTGPRGKPGCSGAINLDSPSSQYAVTTGSPLTALPATLVSWGSPGTGTNGNLISVCDSADAGRRLEILWLGSAGNTVRATHNDGTTTGSATTTATMVGNSGWHFTAAVFRGAADRSIYLDTGNRANNTTSVANSMATLNSIALGARTCSSVGIFWRGLLDGGAVYNTALTDDELQQLRRESLRGSPERLRWVKGTYFAPSQAVAVTDMPYDLPHTPQFQSVMAM